MNLMKMVNKALDRIKAIRGFRVKFIILYGSAAHDKEYNDIDLFIMGMWKNH